VKKRVCKVRTATFTASLAAAISSRANSLPAPSRPCTSAAIMGLGSRAVSVVRFGPNLSSHSTTAPVSRYNPRRPGTKLRPFEARSRLRCRLIILTAALVGPSFPLHAFAQEQDGGAPSVGRFPDAPQEGWLPPTQEETDETADEPGEKSGAPEPAKSEQPSPSASPPPQPPAGPLNEPDYPYGRPLYAYGDEPQRNRSRRRWYGWQTLLVDGGAFILFVGAVNNQNSELGLVGFGGYLLGAPIVHWAHGHGGKGLASFAIRGGSTFLAVLGAAACVDNMFGGDDGPSSCPLMWLGLAGMLAAIPIDAAVLAREKVPLDEASGPRRRRTMMPFHLSPIMDARRGFGGLVVSSSF
jgi:hypothetical protein